MYHPTTKKLTPVMKQYREAKEAYPDAILFFRLGDFYEMFNDDAVVASRELSLTLTSRDKGAAAPVPMAGIPYHAAPGYLAKLVARGHKVAICEQMGDPSKIKGIVPRKVVRVLTPGLLTETDQLEARQNNYLCALDGDGSDETIGLACLDLSTGELSVCALSQALLLAELTRADPAETLVPSGLEALAEAIRRTAGRTQTRIDEALDDDLRPHLDEGVAQPLYDDAAGQHPTVCLRAAARALRFARRYLPDTTLPIRRIARFDPGETLRIDECAQQHLELVRGATGGKEGALLYTLDATVTAPGARLLRRRLLAPLYGVDAIRRRHDAVERFVVHPGARRDLRDALKAIGDLERLATRASLREIRPRELGQLGTSLRACPLALEAVRAVAAGLDASSLDLEVDLCAELTLDLERALVEEPPNHIRDGGAIATGWDGELDELKALRDDGSSLIAAHEQQLRQAHDIPSLKVKYTRAFGYYIEVTKAHLDKVPEGWRRRQTLRNVERYLDDELEELADRVLSAEERFTEREREVYEALVERVAKDAEGLHRLASAVASWDVAAALAEVAHEHDFCRPEVDDGDDLELNDARHPVVERFVGDGRFVPNDTTLSLSGERLWLITGPNMAGKSTLMRQVALCVIMAQMGSFVPASSARIGVVDRVLSRVGASDNLARGESTFMVEMRETATIVRDATERSLVILDEIGRGTSTFDGLAIAWAVAEHLHDAVRCRAMFATHYHQLTELAESHPGVANYSVSARKHEGEIVFLHRITQGAVSKSYGIAVARLAGLPTSVLARAEAILAALETAQASGGQVKPSPQLDLFAQQAAEPELPEAHREVLDILDAVDVRNTTPMQALQLLDELAAKLRD